MKIGRIEIRLIPTDDKDKFVPVTLIRDERKMWFVEYEEQVQTPAMGMYALGDTPEPEFINMTVKKVRGLFPSEVALADGLQKQIVQVFNAQYGGNKND